MDLKTIYCRKCGRETYHRHRHGTDGTKHSTDKTHVPDTEHYKCEKCSYCIYSKEGEGRGLAFYYDGEI